MERSSTPQPTLPNDETDKHSRKSDVSRYEIVEDDKIPHKTTLVGGLPTENDGNDLYAEALARYPNDECINARDENKVRRKLELRILPVLGICYFFYYVDKTTLSVQYCEYTTTCNALTIFTPDLMPPSSDYAMILLSKAKSTHGYLAASILVGLYGRSHLIF